MKEEKKKNTVGTMKSIAFCNVYNLSIYLSDCYQSLSKDINNRRKKVAIATNKIDDFSIVLMIQIRCWMVNGLGILVFSVNDFKRLQTGFEHTTDMLPHSQKL